MIMNMTGGSSGGGGIYPTITVAIDSGSTVTATNGSKTLTGTSVEGSYTFEKIPNLGAWTITATLGSDSDSGVVNVAEVTSYSLRLNYTKIYGVSWDYTATSVWSRTDDAADFVDPVPAVNGLGGSSPFDGKAPWKDMTVVEDAEAGTLVKIPKFWFKVANSHIRRPFRPDSPASKCQIPRPVIVNTQAKTFIEQAGRFSARQILLFN